LNFIVAKVSAEELEFDETNLIEKIVAVVMVFVQDEFEERAGDPQVYGLELSWLVATLLVAVEWEVTQPSKQHVRGGRSYDWTYAELCIILGIVVHTGHKWIELYFVGDLGLVSQQFDLSDVHSSLELHNQLLRENAETLAVPPN